MENFSYSGWWWLPDNEESQRLPVAGTLTFSKEDGLILETVGAFAKRNVFDTQSQKRQLQTYEMLHGQTARKIRAVSLIDCRVISLNSNLFEPDRAVMTLRCSYAYIGQAFLSGPEEKFGDISFDLAHLLDWIGGTGFIHETEKNGAKFTTHKLTYQHSENQKAKALQCEVTVQRSLYVKSSRYEEQWREQSSIGVRHDHELNISDWLSQFVNPVKNLVSLATNRPIPLIALHTIADVETKAVNDTEALPLQVFFQTTDESENGKSLHEEDVLFLLKDSEVSFGELLNRWLVFHERYKDVCSLYFSARYRPRPYLSGRFLVMAQAAEIFHRIKFPSTLLPKDEFRARRIQIVESVPTEHKEWLKSQMMWSNELPLRERIRELYMHTSPAIDDLVSSPEEFIKRAKNTRNYYTHYSERMRSKAATGIELHWITEVLHYMLSTCFLYELGFSTQKVKKLLHRNKSFQFASREIAARNLEW